MKRQSNLWPQIVAWDNLVLAHRRARAGKRFKESVLSFEWDRGGELLRLQQELEGGTYCPGKHRTFLICEPKRRLIAAAPYRDRVVHEGGHGW